MEPITKVSHIPASRWALSCSLCREHTGTCIQVYYQCFARLSHCLQMLKEKPQKQKKHSIQNVHRFYSAPDYGFQFLLLFLLWLLNLNYQFANKLNQDK